MPPLDRPTGTVTFMFTDIEHSTRLLEAFGTDGYARILDLHQGLVRNAIAVADGTEIQTEGDSFFVVFPSATGAVGAAVGVQRALAAADWTPAESIKVRIGIHTGEGRLSTDGEYVGMDVHRAARISAAGHGGQILLSATTLVLVEHSLPERVTTRDLGQHRLKDLSNPERITQLIIEGLPDRFPALATVEATPNNLPAQLSSFLGREHELATLVRLVGDSRLITLTGPGGTGKTRLALEAGARAMVSFPDGVFFVALAPIVDPRLVGTTIAHALGLPDEGSRPPVARVLDYLRNHEILLILDNFEQLTEAAPIVTELLAEAPVLSVMVTSRGALHLYGEQEYPVPPMAAPHPDSLLEPAVMDRFESIRLFVDRASAVRPGFVLNAENASAVATICYRLDGLPLAIELAAARIRLLTPQAILARLENRLDLLGGGARDLPARQQTLRGAIAWSHDMLGAPERGLFACLAVFVGGAGLEAIESVCADGNGTDMLDSMASLADKALVRQADGVAGEARFEMLQTIREFAREQLAAATEGETTERTRRQKHRDLYLAVAEEAAANLMGPGRRLWLDRLEEEHDNLRAALAFSIQCAEPDPALRLCVALWRFWQMRGYLSEGARSTEQALSLPGAAADPALHLRAVESAAGLAYWMGDMLVARRLYQETLAVSQQNGDRAGEANALYNVSLTFLFMSARDLDKGRESAQLALARFREVGDRAGEARALWSLSNWAQATAQPDRLARARDHGEQALTLFTELDDPFMTGWALYTLAQAEFLDGGDLERVPALLGRALRIFAQAEDVSGYTLVVDGLAGHAMRVGDERRSARLSGAVAALERQSGTGLNRVNREQMGFDPSPFRTDPLLAEEWAAGERMPLADVITFAMAAIEGSGGSDDAGVKFVAIGQPRS